MAATEGALPFSAASVVTDVLQQHGSQSVYVSFDARRAEEAAMRRYEAAAWLRKVIGVVGTKDLPTEPSEEEFRLGLRSGIILCNSLNKMQQGAVQKVVEGPRDSTLLPDGAALSAFQYFENVRNFLVAVEEMGLPAFEASDLEQGGKSSRIVNCVLALKSFYEGKQGGGSVASKFGGNVKTTTSGKQHVRKNSEPFLGALSRITPPANEKSLNGTCTEKDLNITSSSSLNVLVRAMISDKKPGEIPNLVESLLRKVMTEFDHRIASQAELKSTNLRDSGASHGSVLPTLQIGPKNGSTSSRDCEFQNNKINDKESKSRLLKQQMVIDRQQKDLKVLKQMLTSTKAGMQFMQIKFQEEIHSLGIHLGGLAHAASGYHKVLVENRKLYNQVQDLKGSIRVYCRVRPFLPGQHSLLSTVDYIEEGTITINALAKARKLSFYFNKVFGPTATQEEVYADTQPLIRSALDGYNVCIFAYGQTGSGKTYTMTGPKNLTENSRGVNYRALSDLFFLAEQRKDTFAYDVSVQMIEIYNEQVRDLLVTDGLNKRLEIRNNSQTGLSVPDANLVHVSSTSDVIDLMSLGQRNRAVGSTALNDRSSRSHSCLTVHVQGRDLTSGNILRGCMHLVDLAGSERVDKSEVTGDRLKEAQHINKSLSALGDVITSLAQKNSHVPYRNSKLTQVLQDSLGGQAKTLMFVHVSPEPNAIGETISTFKFAERVATVELGAARVNKDSSDVTELKEQIASLKAALAQSKVSGSPRGVQLSPRQSISPNPRNLRLPLPNGLSKLVDDVGNIEVCSNSVLGPKKPNFDPNELLVKSPTWPPVTNHCQINGDDDKELSPGDWVDKLMVNRQDSSLTNNKPPDSWKHHPVNTLGILLANTQSDDMLDSGVKNPSRLVLPWPFNHSKNGIDHKVEKPPTKQAKVPELLRSNSAKSGATLSQKVVGPSQSSRWSGNQIIKAKINKHRSHPSFST